MFYWIRVTGSDDILSSQPDKGVDVPASKPGIMGDGDDSKDQGNSHQGSVEQGKEDQNKNEGDGNDSPRIIDEGGISQANPLEQKPFSETKVEVIEEESGNNTPDAQGLERASVSEGEENVAVFASTSQGAVVALALGLAITAILLVFVGCRLRNMKRKLRKGRPMNSNEADYLINGMYL